jgi:hypothetical protein
VNGYLIFNHHSLPFSFAAQAQAAMPEFLRICNKVITFGKNTILIDEAQDRHWYQIQLAPGYSWQTWYEQAKPKDDFRDQIRVFLNIATRQPFFSEDDILAGVDMFEVWQEDQTVAPVALRAASWHDAPLIGFHNSGRWQAPKYHVRVCTLDAAGNLQNTDVTIVNIFSLSTLEALLHSWREADNAALKIGQDLWRGRARYFPHLLFCGKTETQLCDWRQNETVFGQVKHVLNILNEFALLWQERKIEAYSHESLRNLGLKHRVSGESESCSKDTRRRKERSFYLPTGKNEYFENHVKLANGWRIHFFPDHASRCLYIAYIGSHLN